MHRYDDDYCLLRYQPGRSSPPGLRNKDLAERLSSGRRARSSRLAQVKAAWQMGAGRPLVPWAKTTDMTSAHAADRVTDKPGPPTALGGGGPGCVNVLYCRCADVRPAASKF